MQFSQDNARLRVDAMTSPRSSLPLGYTQEEASWYIDSAMACYILRWAALLLPSPSLQRREFSTGRPPLPLTLSDYEHIHPITQLYIGVLSVRTRVLYIGTKHTQTRHT